jgi:protein-disulfide isomerase
MKRFVIAASALSLVLFACQKDSSTDNKKLEEITKKLDEINQKLDRGVAAGAARPQAAQPPAPDPNKVYSVPVAGAPSVGPANAKVTIVKGSEYACPYCDRVRPTLAALKEKYGDDLRIVYKHLIVHPQVATDPALAACAADRQGKYMPMSDLIWEKGFNAGRNLSRENMEKLGQELGLDMNRFKADMDGECKTIVQKDQAELRRVGAGGTPSFFINGRFISGARPQQMFEAVIDQELKKANELIAKGEAKADNYYEEMVVKQGLKSLDGK